MKTCGSKCEQVRYGKERKRSTLPDWSGTDFSVSFGLGGKIWDRVLPIFTAVLVDN